MREQAIYHFHAEDGLAVWLRPLKPTDAPYLIDLFEHMSADSRYQRFNIPLPDPDPDWVLKQAEKLAYVRPAHGRAWLAFADLPGEPQAPVAGIRYIRASLEAAEVALVVRDDLHNLGIGSELLKFAGRKAYAEGFSRLLGLVQSTNQALWHSLHKLDVPLKRRQEGSHTVIEVDLHEAELFHWKPAADREGSV